MLEAMHVEAQEDRHRVMSKAFWENLKLMWQSFMAIHALGTMVTAPSGCTA